ncbi:MAG TPA: hypothetical protein VMT44_00695 [Methanoregula sp.]|nr:hypothetical protein [Methanoregula sp.]
MPLPPADQYMDEMNRQFHFFATWDPTEIYKLGYVGTLDKNRFSYVTTLEDLGIPYTPVPSSPNASLSFRSGKSVTVSVKASGSAALPQFNLNVGDAGIAVDYGNSQAVVFEAEGVNHRIIAQMNKLDDAILNAWKNKIWKDNWVVISDLMEASSATILISKGSKSGIGLKAQATVPALSLACANAQFNAVFSSNMDTQIICRQGLTPLFKARGINKSWLGGASAGEVKGIRPMAATPTTVLSPVAEIAYQPVGKM